MKRRNASSKACGFRRRNQRLDGAEHPAERVVARYAMLQAQEKPQQPFLRSSEFRHIRARLGSAQHCSQRDEQHLQQFVSRIVGARVRQPPENLLELAHPTPSMIRESSSESVLSSNAIDASNPYAIPLLAGRRPAIAVAPRWKAARPNLQVAKTS